MLRCLGLEAQAHSLVVHRSRRACGWGRRKTRWARLPQATSQVGGSCSRTSLVVHQGTYALQLAVPFLLGAATYVRRAFSIHLFDPGKITRAFFPPRGGESVTQSCSPNFRERSADAEVTDVNLPPRICDPLVLPRMSSRSDVAPKTARPGRRGAVVTDITKRPRICDPLTLARTVRGPRRRRGWRSQMCPRCLWAATLPKDAI